MSNPSGFDFTKFVPGFDFLKNLTPGASSAASVVAPGWVAPTLDPEELDKRIQELKTVHFWLDQNTKAVSATIQALEVQRMTLATLQGMNLSFAELAESLKVKPHPEAAPAAAEPAQASEPAPEQAAAQQATKAAKGAQPQSKSTASASAGVDPAHWWGSLTDQFQHIASKAMHDMAHNAAAHAGAPAKKTAAPSAPAKAKAARKTTRQAASKTAAKTTARRKA